jgi:hypothetical protein
VRSPGNGGGQILAGFGGDYFRIVSNEVAANPVGALGLMRSSWNCLSVSFIKIAASCSTRVLNTSVGSFPRIIAEPTPKSKQQ